MKKLSTLVATSILLVSATAANAFTIYQDPTTTMTDTYSSRDAAYQAGLNKLTSLSSASPSQLAEELDIFVTDNMKEDTIHLNNGAYVTVQERMNDNGQVEYTGVVNFDVDYEYNFDDD